MVTRKPAKVRSATLAQYRFRPPRLWALAIVLLGAVLLPGSAFASQARPASARLILAPAQVTIAMLPNGTPPQALADVPGMAPSSCACGRTGAGDGFFPAARRDHHCGTPAPGHGARTFAARGQFQLTARLRWAAVSLAFFLLSSEATRGAIYRDDWSLQ